MSLVLGAALAGGAGALEQSKALELKQIGDEELEAARAERQMALQQQNQQFLSGESEKHRTFLTGMEERREGHTERMQSENHQYLATLHGLQQKFELDRDEAMKTFHTTLHREDRASSERIANAQMAQARFLATLQQTPRMDNDGRYFVNGVDKDGKIKPTYLMAPDGSPMVGVKDLSERDKLTGQMLIHQMQALNSNATLDQPTKDAQMKTLMDSWGKLMSGGSRGAPDTSLKVQYNTDTGAVMYGGVTIGKAADQDKAKQVYADWEKKGAASKAQPPSRGRSTTQSGVHAAEGQPASGRPFMSDKEQALRAQITDKERRLVLPGVSGDSKAQLKVEIEMLKQELNRAGPIYSAPGLVPQSQRQ